MWTGAVLVLTLATCGGCVFYAFRGDPLPTVDGPEDSSLVDQLDGTLVYNNWTDPRRITCVSFPGRRERLFVLERDPVCFTAFDESGNLTYLASDQEEHEVRLVQPEGDGERVLFRDQGDASLHASILLSPVGGRIALTRSVHTGGFRFTPTELFIIDLFGKVLHHEVLGEAWKREAWKSIEWGPAGEVLAMRGKEEIRILNLATGEEETLGKNSVLPKGSWVLDLDFEGAVQDSEFPLPVSFRTQEEGRPQIPGLLFGVIGRVGENLVVYEGLPTTGTAQPYSGAFLVWPTRSWSIKTADIRTGAFATLVHEFGLGYARFGPTPEEMR